MPILHIRDENGQFVPIPAIKGDDGKDGKDGKSAYEQAKEGGYTGTEEEFVDSLNGLTNSEIATHCSDFDNPHKVTAEQAGAAPEQHNHSADAITSGTFDTGRLPIVPVSKGGTGATNLSDVFVGSAELANHLSMNNCSNIDFNTIKTAGFYSGYEGMTNAAFTNEISVLEVIPYSNDWILQRQTRLTDGVMKYRFYSGASGWSDWYLIHTSKNMPSQIEKIKTGIYSGNGKTSQFIDLGETPQAVYVTPKSGEQNYYTSTSVYSYGGLALNGNPCITQVGTNIEIVSGGFRVYNGTSGSKKNLANPTDSDVRYYIAFFI